MDEINRYWQVERDLSTLAAYGLLRREVTEDGRDVRFRGTAEVLLEAYGALEMHQELG
jgi:predicted transcriptional regulator